MSLRQIGFFLILIGLIQIGIGFVAKDQINQLKLAQLPPGCHVGNDPNTCTVLKDSVDWHVALLWVLSIILIGLGLNISFVSEGKAAAPTQVFSQFKKMVSKNNQNDRFQIMLSGLDEDEKKILRTVREQDGIGQNTLCIRTDLSKTKLSLLLSDLEKRGLVRKVPEGKMNRIYIKKAF